MVAAIANAWKLGRETGPLVPAFPIEPAQPEITQRERYQAWRERFTVVAQDVVDTAGKSGSIARCALNGFIRSLRARPEEYEGKSPAEMVDWYFHYPCYSDGTQRIYRIFIAKAFERMVGYDTP